jgi:polyhydroxybutyrate depolymerase
MKRGMHGIACGLAATLLLAVPAFAAGTIHNQTFPDGREAYVYIPEGGAAGKPVVFAYHGHNGSNNWTGDVDADFAKGTFLSTNKIHELWPDAVVVYPNGLKTPGKINDQGGNGSGWQYMPGQYGESDGVSRQTGLIGDRDIKFLDDML